MKFIKKNYLLVAIITLAIFLRFIHLGTIPIGFNDDESAFGYNAYSILKTGKDEWGRFLPFPVFESFGDWKLSGYLYLTVFSQFIFGINEFATRFPSALLGVFSVFATYLLAKELFDKKVAHASAFFLAISPWHIIASRNAFESDTLIFFITISTYFFLKALENKKYLPFSFAGFVVSFYIYRSAWLFTPLFVISLLYFYRSQLQKFKKYLFKNLLVALIFLLPLAPTVLTFRGQSRFLQESFLSGIQKIGILNEVNQRRGVCQKNLPRFLCVPIYNKYTSYLTTYFKNYFSNLSPETYYINGTAGGYQGFSIRSPFYIFELPLLIFGIILLFLKKQNAGKILLPWILLAPVGASITGIGNLGRLNILMPAPQIIAAFGLFSISYLIKSSKIKFAFTTLFSLVLIVAILGLLADMFYYYPQVSGKSQRYGYKQLFDYLDSQKTNYTQIAVSRRTDDAKQYIHYLFFEKIDPRKFYDNRYTIKYRGQDQWISVEKIGNFRFYPSTPDIEKLPPKSLFAVGEKEISSGVAPIYTVNYPNGDIAFEVYKADQIKSELEKRPN